MVLKNKIYDYLKNNWWVYALLLCFGMIVYAPAIIDELPNPDALWTGTLYKDSYTWELSLGRYMIWFWQKLFSYNISTTFNTILAIAVWIVTVQLLFDAIGLEGGLYRVIAGCLMLISPFMQGGVTYYYCFAYYVIAGLFAAIALCLANLEIADKKIKVILDMLGIVLWSFSLATYQAFLGLYISVCAIAIIVKILDSNNVAADIVRRIFHYFFVFVGGVLLYLITNKFVLLANGIQAEESRGFSRMGQLMLGQLVSGIVRSYKVFVDYFFGNGMINNAYGVLISRRSINIAFFIILAVVFLVRMISVKREYLFKIFAVILFIMLPMFLFSIVILAPTVSVYATTGPIMLPATNMIYIFLFALISKMENGRVIKCLGVIVSALVLGMLLQLNNDSLNYLKFHMNQMEYLSFDISTAIEKNMNFDEAHKICIIGRAGNGNYSDCREEIKDSIKWTTASYGTIWNDFYGTQGCWRSFMNNYLGTDYVECNIDEYHELIAKYDITQMPVFPADGSVKYMDGIAVVKLSDDLWE
ncbi:glucosyltransferase domain-containing protein [Butyrivibrio sp. FC2001]|uniref:glucosyltransferase domain-containing protein n=1 Tax=Butyrivibrio sp. FC2001 TaxID=1280671 RepID=UPI00041D29AC|nr:glucosyltransferase domain-containing protein [Butyrivibrio sp. FC2001]